MASIKFYVNSEVFELSDGDPRIDFSLLQFLRAQRYTGCKQVCGEGGCGACTVILSEVHKGDVTCRSVTACLLPVAALDGRQVLTIEGLKLLSDGRLHPLCEAFYKMGASQCGFCTTGFIMSFLSALENAPLYKKDLEKIFDGNLCRCTGYRPILDAAAVFCSDPLSPKGFEDASELWREDYKNSLRIKEIFPDKLKNYSAGNKEIETKECQWKIPDNIEHLFESLTEDSKIISGNTDVGYVEHKRSQNYVSKSLIQSVAGLNRIEFKNRSIEIGSGVTISRLIKELEGHKNPKIKAILTQCRHFANNQIRNMATVGGGLVNFSSYSDLVPVWVATGASVNLIRREGKREVCLQDLYNSSGILNFKLQPQEVLKSIEIPLDSESQVFASYKYARRRMDSITFLSAGCSVKMTVDSQQAEKVLLSFDGLGKTAIRALKTEAALTQRPWNQETLDHAVNVLEQEFDTLISNPLPIHLQDYQRRLTLGILLRFFAQVEKDFFKKQTSKYQELTNRYPVVAHRAQSQFEERSVGVIGKAIAHRNAELQTTGQAKFSLDQEAVGSLYASVITSPVAFGKLEKVDASEALKHRDVVAVYTAQDIPGTNKFGFRVEDEEFLATEFVGYVGQPVAVLVAKSQKVADELSRKVKVFVEELEPLLTMDQAFKARSFHGRAEGYLVCQGDPEGQFANCETTVSGEVKAGGQSHFYLEPQSALVIPQDSGFFIYSSTQSPSNVVDHVCRVLSLTNNQVEVKVGRLGGGFGGKQLRAGPMAALCALASHHTGKPVKLALSREQDMAYCPGRSPLHARYKAGFDSSGKIVALRIHFGLNGGWTSDYSADIAETATLLMDSCYQIENVEVHGHCLKMNHGSYTATRGFGKPQATAIIESILDHGASQMGMDGTALRQRNLYQKGDRTITKTEIKDDVMNVCWQRLLEKADYQEIRKQNEVFNNQSPWLKRGVAVIPSRGNMGFIESNDINRGISVVQILHDGSVSVNHSGCEMGQGINTRMAQVAAHYLKVPLDRVTVTDTQSALISNTPPTTMVASDLIGKAIIKACKELNGELGKFQGSFAEKVEQVYQKGGKLQTTGIHTAPRLSYDYEKQEGDISYFFVWGAAMTVAEVDLISGNFRLLESKIVQDCGKSLNPHLDIGQAEGGFIFGVGYYTLEDMIYSAKGKLITDNVSGYKIPSCGDIPLNWDIELLNYAPLGEGLHNSKGIGESNTQLGLSAFFAIKDAIRNARTQVGRSPVFNLDFPASVDRVAAQLPLPHELSTGLESTRGGK